MKNTLLAILIISIVGCNQSPKIQSINVDFDTLDCLTPDDAIIKFQTLNENTFGKVVTDFLTKNDIEVEQEDVKKIHEWCRDEVFGLVNSRRIEWQLYDQEFCDIEIQTIADAVTGQELFESKVPICNSYLNDDTTVGFAWSYSSDTHRMIITPCAQIQEQVGYVPYYEVEKRDDGYELSSKLQVMKYYVNTILHIEYSTKYLTIVIEDVLIEDKAIMYSGYINSIQEEVEKRNREQNKL